MFLLQVMDLAIANPVFTGAGATHRQSPRNHPLIMFFGASHFSGIFRIDQIGQMEITVAHMTDQRRF